MIARREELDDNARTLELERIYLDQMGSEKLLEPEEELALGKQIDRYRQRWRMLILTTPLGLRRALELLESIDLGEEAMFRTFDTRGEKDQEKARAKIAAELMTVVQEVKKLSEEIQKSRLRMLDPETSQEIRRELQALIKQLFLQAAECIEKCHINTRYFKPWMKENHELGEQMLGRIHSIRNKGKGSMLARKDLRLLEAEHGEASAFAKRLFSMRRRLHEYEEAKEKLNNGNLRLVVSIARRFQHRGLSLLDLIQEGNMGLMASVEGFDWKKGFKFSTYATFNIRQTITRALKSTVRTVHVPVNVEEKLILMKRAKDQFFMDEGRDPTDKELADEMGISEKEFLGIRDSERSCLSLNSPVAESGEAEFADCIPMEEDENADTKESMENVRARVWKALQTLPFREREIIKLRYGLADGYSYTLEEVGTIFKVSRERIRQLEIQGIARLNDPKRIKLLLGYNGP